MPTRYALPDARIDDFSDEFLVVCPRCGQQALVRDRGREATPRVTLTCGACGCSRGWSSDGSVHHGSRAARTGAGDASDRYFHASLWLQLPCCGQTLWANNLRHLAFIEDFVQATLRENVKGEDGWSNQSLRNRLPQWIKDANNRDEILKCVARLRRKAVE
jgi:hypothetical protein